MIVVSMPVTKRCPFRDETDIGHLTVTAPGDSPELHSLAEQIRELATREPVSHEDYTRAVAWLLPAGTKVVTTWQTGPWDVEVTEYAVLREPIDSAGA